MGESGWKSAQPTYRSLTKRPSSVSPAASHLPRRGRLREFHRCGGPPSPEGKVLEKTGCAQGGNDVFYQRETAVRRGQHRIQEEWNYE